MKRIVTIGPESTGKSSLCVKLAEHFNSKWVPEYAREFLLQHGTDYKYEDVLTIGAGQIEGEEKIANEVSGSPLLFIDTDLTVIKVWCEFVFGKCENNILTQIAKRPYDLYLLCNVDAPWVKDELREYPDLDTRERLYHHYKDMVVMQHVPWVDISGNYEERLQKAIDAVNKL